MGRKFGVKEATAASVFATTKEQRQTVVAILGLLQIPMVVTAQVIKASERLTKRIVKSNKKVNGLYKKIGVLDADSRINDEEREEMQATACDWDFSDMQ